MFSCSQEISFEEGALTVPYACLKPLHRIIEVIQSLQPGQKIAVAPKHHKDLCVFCGSSETSQEHIFSKWLRDFFSDKKLRYHINFLPPEEKYDNLYVSNLKLKEETLYGLVTHKVCVKFNNNWLSQLEDQTKRILVDENEELVQNIQSLMSKGKDLDKLAQWLCIKALLLIAKTDIIPKISNSAFHLLQSAHIPEHFLIQVMEWHRYDFEYECSIGAPQRGGFVKLKTMSNDHAFEILKGYFKCTIIVGKLAFRVSYLDETEGLLRKSFIKKTFVLHPFNHSLAFYSTEESDTTWQDTANELKLKIFHSLGLQVDEA